MGMISYDSYLKQIFLGNILLIVCCAFYLAWWMLAFRPENAVKGMKSGWLLIPAAVPGILSVVVILRGMGVENRSRELFSDLDSRAGFYDGMVPLLMAALVMLGLTVVMAVRR